MIVLSLLLLLSVLLNIGVIYLITRASKRLLQFDELVGYLVDDIEANIIYFDKLTSTPIMEHVQEVGDANRNMHTMSLRFNEFIERFCELTGKNVRKATVSKSPYTKLEFDGIPNEKTNS